MPDSFKQKNVFIVPLSSFIVLNTKAAAKKLQIYAINPLMKYLVVKKK
jgi:hypothetical protein